MTATDTNHPTLLDGLIEAATAMRDLPKVQADLEAAQQLASETESKLTAEVEQNASLRTKIAELEASIASKEAALADATFRHGEVQKVLDLIRGALPVQPASASDVSGVVASPEPGAEAEAAPQSIEAKQEQEQAPLPLPEAGTTASSGTTSPSDGGATSTTATDGGASATEDREPSGEAGTATTQNGTDQRKDTPSASNTSAPGTSSNPSANPIYPPRPYYDKPMNQTWQAWRDNGGEVPYWVTDLNAA